MKKELRKNLISIALPIMFQSLILSTINLADVFMIGQVGDVEIASVGLSNQILFLFMLFTMGINNAGGIFVAQYYGRREKEKIKKVLVISFVISMFLAGIFSFLAYFKPHLLIGFYTKDLEVINVAIPYLKIVSISYIFTGLTIVYSTLLRSMGNTKMALYASIVTLITNITLNYLLIFGNFGFPELGVSGAAIATTIARLSEIVAIILISLKNKYPIFFGKKDFREVEGKFIKEFFVTGLPVIGSHVIWSVGTTTLFVIYARVSTAAVTAINISGTIERIAFIGIIGLGSAVSVIVGQELGKGNLDKAYIISKDMLKTNFSLALFISLLLIIFAPSLVAFYNIPEEIKDLATGVIRIFAIIFPLMSLNLTNMVGILRAGGDTKRIFIIDICSMWLTGIPLAFIAYKLSLPIYFVYAFACGEEITKFFGSMYRFVSKKWLNSI